MEREGIPYVSGFFLSSTLVLRFVIVEVSSRVLDIYGTRMGKRIRRWVWGGDFSPKALRRFWSRICAKRKKGKKKRENTRDAYGTNECEIV